MITTRRELNALSLINIKPDLTIYAYTLTGPSTLSSLTINKSKGSFILASDTCVPSANIFSEKLLEVFLLEEI